MILNCYGTDNNEQIYITRKIQNKKASNKTDKILVIYCMVNMVHRIYCFSFITSKQHFQVFAREFTLKFSIRF